MHHIYVYKGTDYQQMNVIYIYGTSDRPQQWHHRGVYHSFTQINGLCYYLTDNEYETKTANEWSVHHMGDESLTQMHAHCDG